MSDLPGSPLSIPPPVRTSDPRIAIVCGPPLLGGRTLAERFWNPGSLSRSVMSSTVVSIEAEVAPAKERTIRIVASPKRHQ